MLKFDGRVLATFRQQAAFSQRELGERVGLPDAHAQQTVSAWERGVTLPDVNTLPLLATALNCRMNDFYTVARPRPIDHTPAAPPTAISA